VEEDVEADRAACWQRFKSAADACLADGDTKPATAFLARVDGMFGAEVAERQRRELWNWIKARHDQGHVG
jgi:hypothetical protein